MNHRPVRLLHTLIAILLLGGCNALNAGSGTGEADSTRPAIVATATPLEAEAQSAVGGGEESTGGDSTDEPAPTAPPTTPPRMSAWPLEADLFYLNDSGQVWRQPLEGDESAAAAVTRLDLVVYDFAVAPGAEWLLYRTEAYLALTSMDGGSGQIVDDTLGLPVANPYGPTMAWSPDAGQIVYSTVTGFRLYIPGGGANNSPQIFDVPEDQPSAGLVWSADSHWLYSWRQDGTLAVYRWDGALLAPVVTLSRVNSAAWLADGRLAWAPVEGGLAVVRPSDLNTREFIIPQDQQVSLIGQQSTGDIGFFVHGNDITNPGLFHIASPDDLSFAQEGSTSIDTAELEWNMDASRLIGPDPDETGHLVMIDPASGASVTIETNGAVTAMGWGDAPPEEVKTLPMPADLYFLAPDEAGFIQLWRLPGNGEPAEAMTDAIADVTAYAISDDGETVAYASEGIIYTTPAGSLTPAQAATINPESYSQDGTLDFSPDGTKLAYTSYGIWVVEIGQGQPIRLVRDKIPDRPEDERLVEVYSRPQWSPDGNWLLIRASYYEGYDLALLSAATPGAPIPLNLYISEGRWMADNRLLVFNSGYYFGDPGLYLVTPGVRPETMRLVTLPVVDAYDEGGDTLTALVRSATAVAMGPTSVRVYELQLNDDPDAPEVLDLAAVTGAHVLESPLLSPDGSLIAGLVRPRYDEFGHLTGRLAIVNPATGELFVLGGFEKVFGLQWGP